MTYHLALLIELMAIIFAAFLFAHTTGFAHSLVFSFLGVGSFMFGWFAQKETNHQ